MFSLSWKAPSSKEQESCLARSGTAQFNYPLKYVGATNNAPLKDSQLETLSKEGYAVNHARVKLGSGSHVFLKARENLQRWRHFQLGWAFVDCSTPIKVGARFCVCSRELCTWIINPLQILYVEDTQSKKASAREAARTAYAFGSGTLQGHLLAGEERFCVEWNKESDVVWYDIYSFSKPAHPLAYIAYPIVRFKQSLFAKHSTEAMLKATVS